MFGWKSKRQQQLDRIETTLCQVSSALGEVAKLLSADAQGVRMTLDDLLKKVSDETAVEQSVLTLLKGLKDQLDAAIQANDPTKIQAVSDAIDANMAAMSAAVTANTPAAPAA